MFPGILLHGLQSVGPAPKLIVHFLIELARLLADFQHPVWWQTQHLGDTRDLVVLRTSREQRQTKEQLDNDTAERPHVNGCRVWQTQEDFR